MMKQFIKVFHLRVGDSIFPCFCAAETLWTLVDYFQLYSYLVMIRSAKLNTQLGTVHYLLVLELTYMPCSTLGK